jgi:CheY-like chemotaxis protein
LELKVPRHVLVINTDQSVLLVVNDLLEDAGYFVSLLSYYDHDLDEIKRLAPDLIILDYRWSADDHGWSLLHLLRLDPETDSIPIVLCTAAAREVDDLQNHLDSLGVKAVLKPFLAATLLTAIADASTSSDGRGAPPAGQRDREGRRPGR